MTKFDIELILGFILAIIVVTGRIVTAMTGKETAGSRIHKRHKRRQRNKVSIVLIAIVIFGLVTLFKLLLNLPE